MTKIKPEKILEIGNCRLYIANYGYKLEVDRRTKGEDGEVKVNTDRLYPMNLEQSLERVCRNLLVYNYEERHLKSNYKATLEELADLMAETIEQFRSLFPGDKVDDLLEKVAEAKAELEVGD